MAKVHGKNTVITAATEDISTYTNNSQMTRTGDKHDTTGYGADAYDYEGGLVGGSFTAEGVYDSTATVTPQAVFKGNEGTKIAFVRKPEGTGTGKPSEAFNLLLEEYAESNPVNDMIKWSIKGTIAGGVTDSTQS